MQVNIRVSAVSVKVHAPGPGCMIASRPVSRLIRATESRRDDSHVADESNHLDGGHMQTSSASGAAAQRSFRQVARKGDW